MSNIFEVISPYDVKISVNINDNRPQQQTVKQMPFQQLGRIINADGDDDFLVADHEVTTDQWTEMKRVVIDIPELSAVTFAKKVQFFFMDIETFAKVDTAGDSGLVCWQVAPGNSPQENEFVNVTDEMIIDDISDVAFTRAGNVDMVASSEMPFTFRLVGKLTSLTGRLSAKISCLGSIELTYLVYNR